MVRLFRDSVFRESMFQHRTWGKEWSRRVDYGGHFLTYTPHHPTINIKLVQFYDFASWWAAIFCNAMRILEQAGKCLPRKMMIETGTIVCYKTELCWIKGMGNFSAKVTTDALYKLLVISDFFKPRSEYRTTDFDKILGHFSHVFILTYYVILKPIII